MSDNPLAALAMRERAAAMIETHVLETQYDGSRVVVPSNLAKEDQHHRSLANAIRALHTTFTDDEMIAAAMQLPEVLALVDALNHAQYGLSWDVRYFKDQDVTKDDPCTPCTRGLSATRAASPHSKETTNDI